MMLRCHSLWTMLAFLLSLALLCTTSPNHAESAQKVDHLLSLLADSTPGQGSSGMEGMKTPPGIDAGKWMAAKHHLLGDTACTLRNLDEPCWCTYLRANKGTTLHSWVAAAQQICKPDLSKTNDQLEAVVSCWHNMGHAVFLSDLRQLDPSLQPAASSEVLWNKPLPPDLWDGERRWNAAPECMSAMASFIRKNDSYMPAHFRAADKICAAAPGDRAPFFCGIGLYHAALSGTGPYRKAMNARPAADLQLCDASNAHVALGCYLFAAVHTDITAAQLGTRHRLSVGALACDSRWQSETCWLAAMLSDSSLCEGKNTQRCDRGRLIRAFFLEDMAMTGSSPHGQTAAACANIEATGRSDSSVRAFCATPRLKWFTEQQENRP